MTTDLLDVKIRHGFDLMDADGSGELTEHDYALMAERASALQGNPDGSPAAQRVHDRYLALWHEGLGAMVPAGTVAVGREQFVSAIRTMVETDLSRAEKLLTGIAEVFLETADLDGDGRVSPQEFRGYQRALFPALSGADMDAAFARLDVDGDGHLSRSEFVRGSIDYWCSPDPEAPGNWWLGPLPGVTD